jgi:hypothetical protein
MLTDVCGAFPTDDMPSPHKLLHVNPLSNATAYFSFFPTDEAEADGNGDGAGLMFDVRNDDALVLALPRREAVHEYVFFGFFSKDDDDDCVVVAPRVSCASHAAAGRPLSRSEAGRDVKRVTRGWDQVAKFDESILDAYTGELDVTHANACAGFFSSRVEYASASQAQLAAYAAALLATASSAQWFTYAEWSSPPSRSAGGRGEGGTKRARIEIDLTLE